MLTLSGLLTVKRVFKPLIMIVQYVLFVAFRCCFNLLSHKVLVNFPAYLHFLHNMMDVDIGPTGMLILQKWLICNTCLAFVWTVESTIIMYVNKAKYSWMINFILSHSFYAVSYILHAIMLTHRHFIAVIHSCWTKYLLSFSKLLVFRLLIPYWNIH